MTHKLLTHLPALCNMVRRIAIEAGEIVLDYYDGGPKADLAGVQEKDDGSPVTLADQEAEAFITAELLKIFPEVPVVGEEAVAKSGVPDIGGGAYFWLVDALDGTKEFIAGTEDFTVNIALIRGGVPVLGVVYLPATGHLFAGCGEGTAVRWNDESKTDKSISVRRPSNQGITVVSSRNHVNEDELNAFLADFKVNKVVKRGSSMKICMIAEGKADMYPRLGRTCEWDIAAAHAVLEAAGGVLVKLDGQAFTYGHVERDMFNPEFVAASVNWMEPLEE